MSAQFLFFSGKGGVGKTTLAAATAVQAADGGQRTLIVTTDPASNLADVFEQPIGHQITPIKAVPGLWAMEIDPERATTEYIDRAMSPIRESFPLELVRVMEEQMSGPCTAEVAAFDRFVDFLDNPTPADATPPDGFDMVIFDTAPTGHTIRLLELPAEWTRAIDAAAQGSGQTCIGPAAAIQDARQKYARALAILRDPARTTFTFVLQPEATAIRETRRAIGELSKLGISTAHLLINSVIPASEAANPLFAARRAMQGRYLAQIAAELPLPARQIPLLATEIKGVARLRETGRLLVGTETPEGERAALGAVVPEMQPVTIVRALPAVLTRLQPAWEPRTLFFTGKGGVGKTVAACLTAVWLARAGYKTLLLTTDPAAHLSDVLGVPVGDTVGPVPSVPQLSATRIDPKAAGAAYKARLLATARAQGRPASALAVMAEELDSPCTEEMAAFDLFIDYAAQEAWEVTVFDTAPTGHTLRLLELPLDWSKQLDVKVFASVETQAADTAAQARFQAVIDRMRDPARSTLAYVLYPEATPIAEAYRASEELRRLGIAPGLVVANFVMPTDQCTTPFTQARAAMQARYLAELPERFGAPVLPLPLLPTEIRGLEMLAALGEQVYGPAARQEPAGPMGASRAGGWL